MQKLLIRKLLNTALREIGNGRIDFAWARLAELREILPGEYAATLQQALEGLEGLETVAAVEHINALLKAVPATYGMIPAGTRFSYALNFGGGAVGTLFATKRKHGVEYDGLPGLGHHFKPDRVVQIID